jgi:uncharacterized protein YdiU (UPF0061 family)
VLADHVIARHYPKVSQADKPYLGLLTAVIDRQAELIAGWQRIGFIHGVMNSDNTSIAGETIDYGPCAFMDSFHPDTVFSSIDHGGRYAYGNQPSIAQWNMAGFAQTLVPLIDEAIQTFNGRFEGFDRTGMRHKIGLAEEREGDAALVRDLLTRMADNKADFTLTFRRLSDAIDATDEHPAADARVSALFENPAAFDEWAVRWRKRLASESQSAAERQSIMRSVNPAFIPRNHLIEEVIVAAVEETDLAPFHRLVEVLESPYEEQPAKERYAAPPSPEEIVHQTFCGT